MITESDDGFEEEKGQLVQGSMPRGFSPSAEDNGDDDGISTYAIGNANTMEDIPNLANQKMKFVEVHARSTNVGPIYLTDPQGVAGDPTHVKSGREIEPGKPAGYPLRGRTDMGRPRIWAPNAGDLYTVSRGY